MTDDDLITWIHAQLDDDERMARAAIGGGRWHYSNGDSVGAWTLYDEEWAIASLETYRTEAYDYAERMPAFRSPLYVDADANGTHIARWDPVSVLADIEAKRLVIDVLRGFEPNDQWESQPDMGQRENNAAGALRALALPYANRPGHRAEWRPSGVVA